MWGLDFILDSHSDLFYSFDMKTWLFLIFLVLAPFSAEASSFILFRSNTPFMRELQKPVSFYYKNIKLRDLFLRFSMSSSFNLILDEAAASSLPKALVVSGDYKTAEEAHPPSGGGSVHFNVSFDHVLLDICKQTGLEIVYLQEDGPPVLFLLLPPRRKPFSEQNKNI
jgi:hypothetical protein